jgi:squalene synthase HpnD/squalene synthase HpnC
MKAAEGFEASKTEREENFPVASFLVNRHLRAPIRHFYHFARAADDIADHRDLSEADKLAGLDALEETLLGKSDRAKAALPLRDVLAEWELAPTHPLDLLTAFRADVTKQRYDDWDELMQYCRYSAMPVGRFVLDLHGEDRSTWAYSDPLCAALQVINHLQDCGRDYRTLQRVYLPLDMMQARGAHVEELAAPKASPQLRAALKDIAERTAQLLPQAKNLPVAVQDTRLGLETGVIVKLAHRLTRLLLQRDPLCEPVHLARLPVLLQAVQASVDVLAGRLFQTGFSARGSGPVDLSDRDALGIAPAPVAKTSSFYLAMRILPPEQRDGMYAIYAFCRAVDDIADDSGPAKTRTALLDRWRADIVRLYDGGGPTMLTKAIAPVVSRFDLRQEDFLAVVDGMEMDLRREMQRPDWETFELYCDRVASAVGRLSVRIFGIDHDKGIELSHHLGRALQMTNVLRDLDEDASLGRLYLPNEVLADAGIYEQDIEKVLLHPSLSDACMAVASRAERHFVEASMVMANCDRQSVRSPRIMASVYQALLDKLVKRGWTVPRDEIRPSKLQFIEALLRYGLV